MNESGLGLSPDELAQNTPAQDKSHEYAVAKRIREDREHAARHQGKMRVIGIENDKRAWLAKHGWKVITVAYLLSLIVPGIIAVVELHAVIEVILSAIGPTILVGMSLYNPDTPKPTQGVFGG